MQGRGSVHAIAIVFHLEPIHLCVSRLNHYIQLRLQSEHICILMLNLCMEQFQYPIGVPSIFNLLSSGNVMIFTPDIGRTNIGLYITKYVAKVDHQPTYSLENFIRQKARDDSRS